MSFYELSGEISFLRKSRNQIVIQSSCTDSTANSCKPGTIKLYPGFYQFECWGANSNSARGGYTKGCLYIKQLMTLYLYIGKNSHIFNAVPPHDYSNQRLPYPSGASDIRLSDGLYSSFDSIKTRIMVAGAAGNTDWSGSGGFGGGLIGGTGITYDMSNLTTEEILATGGTQTSGGYWSGFMYSNSATKVGFNGSFGLGGYTDFGSYTNVDSGPFGSGGYYGSAGREWYGAAGGGSSFISGHPGCDAITENSTEKNIIHTGQPIHYSGVFFGDTVMRAGNESMPEVRESSNRNGAIRIKFIRNPFYVQSCFCKQANTYAFIFVLSLISK